MVGCSSLGPTLRPAFVLHRVITQTVTTEQIKNLTISGCENIGVVVDDIVTTVEIINCKKVQVQAKNSAGSWIVDKCDRTTIYLPEGSVKDKVRVESASKLSRVTQQTPTQAVVVSCMSSATNVLHSTPGGEDMVENAIPEQIQSTFTLGAKPVHEVVIPDAE